MSGMVRNWRLDPAGAHQDRLKQPPGSPHAALSSVRLPSLAAMKARAVSGLAAALPATGIGANPDCDPHPVIEV